LLVVAGGKERQSGRNLAGGEKKKKSSLSKNQVWHGHPFLESEKGNGGKTSRVFEDDWGRLPSEKKGERSHFSGLLGEDVLPSAEWERGGRTTKKEGERRRID